MNIYVAGALREAQAVRGVQEAVTGAGHVVSWDWTNEADSDLRDYSQAPDVSARIAQADLRAVMDSDAVLVVVGEEPGLGMFIELGAALACAERGESKTVVLLGTDLADSVFYFHPAIEKHETVQSWLATL